MERVQVADGIWACLQDGSKLGESNNGLIRGDGSGGGAGARSGDVLVVDTFYDLPRTQRMLDLYAEVEPTPPARLVNTHHNGDHCWGNQLLAEAGAEIIGHQRCIDYFLTEASPELFVALQEMEEPPPSIAGFVRALAPFDFHGIVLTPPTTAVDDQGAELDLGRRSAQLLPLGPAHTAGDLAVWVPDAGVLFTGDLLFRECTPIGWEGTYAAWIGALETMAALGPEVVVPGHGPVCGVEGLLEMRDYLAYVRAEAAVHHAAGRTTLEAAAAIELGRFGDWAEPERLAFQVYRAYRELDGVPWDEKVDAGRVFGETAQLKAVLDARAAAAG